MLQTPDQIRQLLEETTGTLLRRETKDFLHHLPTKSERFVLLPPTVSLPLHTQARP